jgi:hypothetical protein
MRIMNKLTAIPVFTCMILGGATLYFWQRHQSALQRIERLEQDHATQVSRLTEKYQAEIRDLEQYILNQYRRAPLSTGGSGPAPLRVDRDQTLAEPMERKYRYLLSDVSAADGESLRQLLLERESAASNANAGRPDYESRLAEIDARIGELLDAADYQKFTALKKSDVEQHHLNIYARGINPIAPLSPEQNQALLFAKLRHKKIFEDVLRDSGIQHERLSPTERAYAHKAITQALQQYRNDYLEEAKSLLEEDQFMLLSSYETTEFQLELERLQAQINAKM